MLYYLVNFDHTLETWTQRQEVKKTRDSLPPVYFSFGPKVTKLTDYLFDTAR